MRGGQKLTSSSKTADRQGVAPLRVFHAHASFLCSLLALTCSWGCGHQQATDGRQDSLPGEELPSQPRDQPDAAALVLDAGAASRWQVAKLGACGEGTLRSEAGRVGAVADWSEGAKVPREGASNRLGQSDQERSAHVRRGNALAVSYPVDVTASWMPRRFLDGTFKAANEGKPLAPLLPFFTKLATFEDIDDFERWLGLHAFPDCDSSGPYGIPFPDGVRPDYGMGSTRRELADAAAVTYGCAGCHASRLFGRTILGLQNRFPRANAATELARSSLGGVDVASAASLYEASEGETRLLEQLQKGLRYVGTSAPLVLGLDTSVAQVALSLAKRALDPQSTRLEPAAEPRADRLDGVPADSKPGNWWTLKYKNRWLLDGSVVSGNPIYTNLLWNELGRGTALEELDAWVDSHPDDVADLTAAVFHAEPPRFTDFFPAESLSLESAKRGQRTFEAHCASCHGSYAKGWDEPDAPAHSLAEQLGTLSVRYHETTPVLDVGTDPLRYQGMSSLTQLNELAFSRERGMTIRVQQGYVPPPLVGIWARFPYFHNNAVPSLCALLMRAEDRPVTYYAGEQDDPARDFDAACNGYPSGAHLPAAWTSDPERLYDTRRQGLSNAGHDEGVFLKDGRELLSDAEKHDLVVFLQTL